MKTEWKGLDRLCGVYKSLNDEEKRQVIRLAEGLLDQQKFLNIGKELKNGNCDFNNGFVH